ncbi:MAG: RnfABCDGE type electron transport complex subunit D [Halanaerobiaceae bacterium]|nr:RnfABCDGE type electron transport complex subunit D [Halanaerobiaceae bacterium]
MKDKRFMVSSSPHLRDKTTNAEIMWSVVLALVPAIIAAVYFFGLQALVIIITSVAGSVVTEFLFQKARGKKVTINDGSAVVTGVLLALTLPPTTPLWTVLIGSAVAIGLGKQVFGGLGHNPFNPALVGRAFLMAAYPMQLGGWVLDGQTTATPLTTINTALLDGTSSATVAEVVQFSYWDLFIGRIGGCLGETSALALLLGAAYLFYKGFIDWRIPAGMLSTVFIVTLIAGRDPIAHLLAGGLILGAFFMATDMVTSPVTKRGRWIFGIGTGLLVAIIRLWGGYPEGVMYAILIMNTAVPLIDYFTRPRTFGEVA